jgi:hypothetical protein
MKFTASLLLFALSVALTASGCKESPASARAVASAPQSASAAPAVAANRAVATTKIVFIDKEHGCQCTAKRVDAAWVALQSIIAGKEMPTVERVHMDTQPEMAERYGKLRPMLAVPALYFMDAKDGLVELLQGEVTSEQITAVLGAVAKH